MSYMLIEFTNLDAKTNYHSKQCKTFCLSFAMMYKRLDLTESANQS